MVDDEALGQEQHVIKDVKELWRRLQQADERRQPEAVSVVGQRRDDRLQSCAVQPYTAERTLCPGSLAGRPAMVWHVGSAT